jgi:transcriptional regulator with XRE-family HTH domain
MDSPLRKLRLSRQLTLMDVAKATDIDTGNLSRIENGSQKSLAKAERLVGFFGHDAITEIEILYPERFGFVLGGASETATEEAA